MLQGHNNSLMNGKFLIYMLKQAVINVCDVGQTRDAYNCRATAEWVNGLRAASREGNDLNPPLFGAGE